VAEAGFAGAAADARGPAPDGAGWESGGFTSARFAAGFSNAFCPPELDCAGFVSLGFTSGGGF
jgi:hypothetical protein